MMKLAALLGFAFLVMLAGCTTRSEAMLKTMPTAVPVASTNPLQHAMAIGQVADDVIFLDNVPVDNDTFKIVLQQRLTDSGLAAASPSYMIDAQLHNHAEIDWLWKDRNVEENITYSIRQAASQQQLFTVTIKTTAVVQGETTGEITSAILLNQTYGPTLKLSAAYENAVKENIQQFMQKLAQWQPGDAVQADNNPMIPAARP